MHRDEPLSNPAVNRSNTYTYKPFEMKTWSQPEARDPANEAETQWD